MFSKASLTLTSFLQYFSFDLFITANANSGSKGYCIAPLTPMQQQLFQVLTPLIAWGQLLIIMIVHFLLFHLFRCIRRSKGMADDAPLLSSSSCCKKNNMINNNNNTNTPNKCYSFMDSFFVPSGSKFHKTPYIRTSFALFLSNYSSIATTSINFQVCTEVGIMGKYNNNYPSINCQSTDYYYYQKILLIFLIAIFALPIIMLLILIYANKKKLLFSNRKFFSRYGILYENYRPSLFIWEFIVILRRLILIILLALLDVSDYIFTYISIFNFFFLTIHVLSRPFSDAEHNQSETISLIILLLISISLTPQNIQTNGNTSPLSIIMFILTIVFVLFLLIRLVKKKLNIGFGKGELDNMKKFNNNNVTEIVGGVELTNINNNNINNNNVNQENNNEGVVMIGSHLPGAGGRKSIPDNPLMERL